MRDYVLSTPSVLKPVILFCTHALRMRDTRSCTLIIRVLRSIIPDFAGPSDVANEVREFISIEVLKACITSLHDPYFVDLQKDLASLIGSIIFTYLPRTQTPQLILLSLPSMTTEKVDRAVKEVYNAANNPRHQRALVLNLLEDLRSVSISEQGKIPKADPRKLRSEMQQKYVTADMDVEAKEPRSPDLEGIVDIFK
jgi:exportin-5